MTINYTSRQYGNATPRKDDCRSSFSVPMVRPNPRPAPSSNPALAPRSPPGILGLSAGYRAHIRTTHPVEGLHNALQTLQQNASCSFQTEREAIIKTWIHADCLQRSVWLRHSSRLLANLPEWLRYFQTQYESELLSQPLHKIYDNNPWIRCRDTDCHASHENLQSMRLRMTFPQKTGAFSKRVLWGRKGAEDGP